MVTRDAFKVLKFHSIEIIQNITHSHKSQNALAFIRFPRYIKYERVFTLLVPLQIPQI